ncbi:hypothetical protein [Streptomyces montanisoli]|uniref:DUF11 domain-containing protein n=1 Tax=Streptomyces montanisoli TaxID=2798581 RepID=A0A940RVR5_9ACTN|nr:hypothetical protein [Streptomyces montanisoli]MBP0455904.1 hypothetical protein [Streptomyces montanisoli]
MDKLSGFGFRCRGFRALRVVVGGLLVGAAVVAGLVRPVPAGAADAPELVVPAVFYVPRDADQGSSDLRVQEKWADGDLAITFDASGLKGVASIRTGLDACPVRLPVFHCSGHGTSNQAVVIQSFHLSPAKGATAGDSGVLRYRVAAPGRAAVTGHTVVMVGKPVLEASAHADRGQVDPGGRVEVSLTVHNSGDLPARGVSFFMNLRHGFVFGSRHRNCLYKRGSSAWCRLPAGDVTIPAGGSYHLKTPETVRAASDAMYPRVSFEVAALSADYVPPDEIAPQYHPGDGPAIGLVPGGGQDAGAVKPADDDPAVLEVPVRSHSDLVALAGTVKGPVGSRADVRVGVRNNGPGDLPAPVKVEFTVPDGTTVVASPYDPYADEEVYDQRCRALGANGRPLAEASVGQPSARRYVCTAQKAGAAGTTTSFPFTLRIDDDTVHTGGRVRVTDGDAKHPSRDTSAADDTARVAVSVWPGPSWATPGLYETVGVLLAVLGLAAGIRPWRRRRRARVRAAAVSTRVPPVG